MSKNASSFDSLLRDNLPKYLRKIKNMENGGGLHSMVLSLVEKPLIRIALEETDGNQTKAAHLLGVNRNTLRRKMHDYKIKIKS
ncbi:hypothetical protein MNBD_NITROSPINAE02-1727 [hydrothermal vent metagenome]|uniref:Putative Fis-like DNA-binding protein n=1 Tax=hydrothermal vent metagenome TaxID=652676 RepID=A0A3B1BMQ7_9ZZZZ